MRGESLTLADAVRYQMSTPGNPMEIGVVLLLADAMAPSQLEQLVTGRLLLHERFRQTVAEAPFPPLRPSWRAEAGFDPAAHVTIHAGPALSHEELARRVSERFSERLSFKRSPWCMEIFPLDDGTSALLFRVHHCIADGLSLVRLLCEIADEPRPARPQPSRSSRPRERSSSPRPRRAAQKIGQLCETLLRMSASHADPAQELHVLRGTKRVAWSSGLDLMALSRAAETHGRHVTELLLAATAEALAKGLSASGRAVPRSVHALVPFGAALGRRELGNHYASTFVDLALDEPDAWRRIERTAATTDKLNDPGEARLTQRLIGLAGWLAPPFMRFAVNFFSRRASVVLSNVPGPSEPVRLLGHAVSSIIVFAPATATIGVSFTLFGYQGELRLGVETDAAVPLAPRQLVADFEQALRGLSQADDRA